MTIQIPRRHILTVAISIGVLSCLSAPRVVAQDTEEEMVLQAVNSFFRAMTEKDESLARSVMREDGVYYGVNMSPDGESVFRNTHSSFFERVGKETRYLVETMYKPHVMIRGPVAAVWSAYDFFQDDEFSHCGVDVFVLIRSDGQWQISTAAFTMERSGCEHIRDGF